MRCKKIIIYLIAIISVFLLMSCGKSNKDVSVDEVENKTVEGADVLSGLWHVGAIYYKNNIIDIQDVEELEDLYDGVYLTFNKDGSFVYYNGYIYKGNYTKYGQGEYESYLLKTNALLKHDIEKGELVEQEIETDKRVSYIIILLDEGNTFEFNEFDSVTGKAKADRDPLIYVKDESSEFIDENKTEITKNNEEKKDNNNSKDTNNSGYTKPSLSTDSGNVSSGKRNALERALEYLDYTSFSYSGLIDQLEFEGFTPSQAEYGASKAY